MSRNTPFVFISSTSEDLGSYRNAAKEAALQAGFHPEMMEYFAAQSQNPPYATCMKKIDPCDVLIVIVAHRYGWVPPDQPGEKKDKSITWLECERAQSRQPRTEVITFLVDEKPEPRWPLDLYEAYRSTKAIEDGTDTPELIAEVRRNVAKLKEFKQWLSSLGTRRSFSSPKDLKGEVLAALYEWRDRHPEFRAAALALAKRDPAIYLSQLRDETAWIDIRGLQVGTGKAHRFPIGDLYIPLKTVEAVEMAGGPQVTAEAGKAKKSGGRKVKSATVPELDPGGLIRAMRSAVPLEHALRHSHLVIVGDPGSGKSTFLRRIAYELSCDGQPGLGLAPGFPVLVRVAELEQHIRLCMSQGVSGRPASVESPAWISHFLAHRALELRWGLDAAFFEDRLAEKSTYVLLDGLDESVGRAERESMARLLEKATTAHRDCRFVVTTRPGSYQGMSTLAGFQQVRIDDLEPEAIESFLRQWSANLFVEDAAGAKSHLQELLEALHARAEIGGMARNPVMLTALAVVHWNEKRLPEQRADLYESILIWLARSREQRLGRERAERCLALLGHLALAMQDQPQGRRTQVSLGRAAEMIAPQFREVSEDQRLERARAFLAEEEVDSGIVVSRGSELRFWHLTFQEFLAARAIAGLAEKAQQDLLLASGKLYQPEWREVILLLAGTLLVRQGAEKVDGLFRAVLGSLGTNPSLADQARCAGLLGAALADLRPLAYKPPDARYDAVLKAVMGIFDAQRAAKIDLGVRLEAAEALGQAGDPRLRSDNDNWVTIPAGKFLMGAQKDASGRPNYDEQAQKNESSVHEVSLKAFQIGRYPVTVEEFRRFMGDEGYQNQKWWKAGGFGQRRAPDAWEEQTRHLNRPVVNVTWYEAAAWCAWAGGRLSTEAEWERAARGTEGRKYPWGNEEPDAQRANYDKTEILHATPVGLFPLGMTPEGLHDMAGNVWEWCSDWYADYGDSPGADPKGLKDAQYRVLRGGSWYLSSIVLRSAGRYWFHPGGRVDGIGFRCVREVLP